MQFAELVERLREGDDSAVREFVARYEPIIRRVVRRKIESLRLQAAADSVDVCQSALGSFLIRCADGEYEFESSQQMENLLKVITRRKVARLARHEYSPLRNRTRNVHLDSRAARISGSSSNPGDRIANTELMEAVFQRLTRHEQRLFARRRQGDDWKAIADDEGETCAILRQRLSRAIRRVATSLRLNDE